MEKLEGLELAAAQRNRIRNRNRDRNRNILRRGEGGEGGEGGRPESVLKKLKPLAGSSSSSSSSSAGGNMVAQTQRRVPFDRSAGALSPNQILDQSDQLGAGALSLSPTRSVARAGALSPMSQQNLKLKPIASRYNSSRLSPAPGTPSKGLRGRRASILVNAQ